MSPLDLVTTSVPGVRSCIARASVVASTGSLSESAAPIEAGFDLPSAWPRPPRYPGNSRCFRATTHLGDATNSRFGARKRRKKEQLTQRNVMVLRLRVIGRPVSRAGCWYLDEAMCPRSGDAEVYPSHTRQRSGGEDRRAPAAVPASSSLSQYPDRRLTARGHRDRVGDLEGQPEGGHLADGVEHMLPRRQRLDEQGEGAEGPRARGIAADAGGP